MLNSAQIETIKNGLSLAGYVREELKKRSVSPDSIDKDVVSAIISSSTEAKDKLPQDPTTQGSLYKVIAAQIKISNEITGKDSISKDDLIKLLGDSCVAEAIQETGLIDKEVSEILGNSFDMLIGLSESLTSTNLMAQMFTGPILTKLHALGITDNELNELSKIKKIPLSLLPKLPKIIKDSELATLIEGQGINLSLLELLPLLLNNDLNAKASPPPLKGPTKPERNGSSSPAALLPASPEELASALGGVLEGAGFKKDEEKKPATPQKPEKKEEKIGWGNGYGKWIIGACSAGLAGIGFFVEDNIMKTVLLGLGALGLGGTIASNIEGVGTILGAPTKS